MPKQKKQIDLIAYSTDASMIPGQATGVVFPETAEKIRQTIVSSSGITIRGGGSSLVGGAVPLNCVVVDLSKMNKILKFDADKRIVDVEAGVILDELNSFLDKYGLEFPVKPSSHTICTIGGMISTNAVGSRALKYGRTSNWVDSIEIVNGKGEFVKVKKTDLSDVSGMEGITGVIVKARLRLAEKKKRTASLFSMESLQTVYDSVMKLKLLKDVCAIEFMDKVTSKIMGLEESYHVIVEFESDEGKMKDFEYDELMNLRDGMYPTLAGKGYSHIEDPKLLLGKFVEFAEFLELNKVPFFGHLGVGILHPCFRQEQKKLIGKTLELAKRMHGQVSGEHGIGLAKKQFLDNTEKKLIERVKKRYDPLGKLNCGKMINGIGKEDNSEKIDEKVEKELEEAFDAKAEGENES